LEWDFTIGLAVGSYWFADMTHAKTAARRIATVNPATEQVVREFEPHTDREIEARLCTALAAFEQHRRTSFPERVRLMTRVAAILDEEKRELGRTITLEMGKPIRAAIQEVEKCASACRYYAENAARFLADEETAVRDTRSYVRYQPLGPVLAVMPWNFPFWQVFRFASPALMAGNVGVLKHASNVPQCALAIEGIFRRAGFPDGVFQTLLIGSEQVEKLISDERIRAVTLTGSIGAGRKVGAVAGKEIKKTVLELGGSDPFIIMPSADLAGAVAAAVQARTINNGQSCIAAKRFIVDQQVADEFERRFVERMAGLKVGDPMLESTDIGPLATAEVLAGLGHQVERTIQMGAKLHLGGQRVEGLGFFYPPTVLADIPPASPASCEELFGPVACLFRCEGISQAITIANSSAFGLGSCLWTRDERERDMFIDQIEAGLAFVNGMVASDPLLPFGGIKRSGYGRELSSHGIREFVNIKTVSIREVSPYRSATE
jgi:succinate-semialdehyde dehydrogenase / glutarate-semialdehyde dehydrogenase